MKTIVESIGNLSPKERINIKTGGIDFRLSKDSYGITGSFVSACKLLVADTDGESYQSLVHIGDTYILSTSDILYDSVVTLADALADEKLDIVGAEIMLIKRSSKSGNSYVQVALA